MIHFWRSCKLFLPCYLSFGKITWQDISLGMTIHEQKVDVLQIYTLTKGINWGTNPCRRRRQGAAAYRAWNLYQQKQWVARCFGQRLIQHSRQSI